VPVFFDITIVRVKFVNKGNPAKKRHRKQHSGEPCRQQAIVRGPSKRSTAIIFFQNCRTQCDPQHPADDRKACSGERGTDELYCLQGNSRAGGVSAWCARVPEFFVLFSKKNKIERLQKECKKTD
jgi:hypothetical protein